MAGCLNWMRWLYNFEKALETLLGTYSVRVNVQISRQQKFRRASHWQIQEEERALQLFSISRFKGKMAKKIDWNTSPFEVYTHFQLGNPASTTASL